ncbi:MAG: pantoate--beta-alanine ligase [Firmicutes bacterium]|nr:pantoate--beta-alanine ligase [Bacillota bacterium]
MIAVTTIEEVRQYVASWKKQGYTIGLVPTMGYLHEGHASLVDKAVEMCDKVVVSDFVNPTQFGPGEDLETYPRDFEMDCKLLEEHGADLVFHPEVDEMYLEDAATYVEILNDMPKQLCGKTRPIHFRGVCTVVSKLFNIVTPDKAFFGMKDAQQLSIICKMVRDMSYGIEIVGCPIIREDDGLAKSSRNTYLSPEERKAALVLSKAVKLGEGMARNGEKSCENILKAQVQLIEKEPLAKIDYVSAVDFNTLKQSQSVEEGTLFAMAVYIGKTRLIDNFLYKEGE